MMKRNICYTGCRHTSSFQCERPCVSSASSMLWKPSPTESKQTVSLLCRNNKPFSFIQPKFKPKLTYLKILCKLQQKQRYNDVTCHNLFPSVKVSPLKLWFRHASVLSSNKGYAIPKTCIQATSHFSWKINDLSYTSMVWLSAPVWESLCVLRWPNWKTLVTMIAGKLLLPSVEYKWRFSSNDSEKSLIHLVKTNFFSPVW